MAGIVLAGDEVHPVEPFAEVMAAARSAGVHVVHHGLAVAVCTGIPADTGVGLSGEFAALRHTGCR